MRLPTQALLGWMLGMGLVGIPAAGAEEEAAAKTAQETGPVLAGEVLAGPQWYVQEDPNNSAKFNEYREVPNGFVLEFLSFSWLPRPGYYLDLSARDVSQLDQRIGFDLGKRDLWQFSFHWAENPRRWSDRARQLFTSQGGGDFTLNDTLQAAVQAAPPSADTAPADGQWDAGTKGALIKSAIETSAAAASVGWQREVGSFDASFTPTRHWTFDVGAQRERRSGTAPQSLGMYFALAPAELAAPLDFKTDQARVGGEYAAEHWNIGAQLMASEFETGTTAITWDDQLFLVDTPVNATTANPARGRMSPWSNSDLWGWKLYGGASFAGHSRINATYSQSTTTQDDPFLPTTINGLLLPIAGPLPAASLDGKYELNLGSITLASRPFSWLRYSAWFRDYNYDNKTPSLTFADYVATDYQFSMCGSANACGATTNRLQRRSLPFAYEKTDLGASAGFRPISWMDVIVAFDREKTDRNIAAVTSSDEDTVKVALDFDVNDWLTLRVTARRQERRADGYDAEYFLESFPIGEANIAAANEGERKYMWTDRDRDSGALMVEISPTPIFSVFAEATYAKEEFFDPITGKRIGESFTLTEDRNFDTIPENYTILLAGRIDDKITTYSVGGTVTPGARWSLYADYTWEDREYRMASRYRNVSGGIGTDDPLDDWGSDTTDRYDTANLGFDAGLTENKKWRLNGDFSWSRGTDLIHTHFVPGGAASGDTTLTEFPKVKTILSIAQVGLTYKARTNLDLLFRYWYEKWDEDNFASDFNLPYMGDPGNDPGSREAIYLGLDFLDYTNQILGFMVRFHSP
ncbi:MAG TPA: MtrB/PioB family outer membrane beta-barrel protein [Candidatus Polarisedimenticolia bacterium]|nr:MtrB/PioB family outer membrane beta-barrel protein [Candidatus Polarisedimenticolia bacterium]